MQVSQPKLGRTQGIRPRGSPNMMKVIHLFIYYLIYWKIFSSIASLNITIQIYLSNICYVVILGYQRIILPQKTEKRCSVAYCITQTLLTKPDVKRSAVLGITINLVGEHFSRSLRLLRERIDACQRLANRFFVHTLRSKVVYLVLGQLDAFMLTNIVSAISL